jgi:hypothetical protein
MLPLAFPRGTRSTPPHPRWALAFNHKNHDENISIIIKINNNK